MILREMDEAESKAWDALARYKFWMFGYWAAIWVHLNRVSGAKRPSPFAEAVSLARERKKTMGFIKEGLMAVKSGKAA